MTGMSWITGMLSLIHILTCSRTNVNKELDLMRTVFGFTEEEIEKMEEYAWEARFLKD